MTETSEKIDKVFAEVEKVITKFTGISEHATKLIQNEIASLDQLRTTLSESKHWKLMMIVICGVNSCIFGI